MLPNVPFHQPIHQYFSWGQNNSPRLPPIQPAKSVAPYVGQIAGYMAQDFTDSAYNGGHPGRILTYNILGQNGFDNPDFGGLLSFTCDLLALESMKTGTHPGQLIPRVVQLVCSLAVGIYVCDYWNTGLSQVCPPDIFQQSQRAVNTYQQLQRELKEVQMRASGNFGTGNMNQMPLTNQFADRYAGGMSASNTGMFQQVGRQHGILNQVAPDSGRFATIHAVADKNMREAEEVSRKVEQMFVDDDLEYGDNLVWKPSLVQPYRLAHDPLTHFAELFIGEGGTVYERILPMDELTHAIPGSASDKAELAVRSTAQKTILAALSNVVPSDAVVEPVAPETPKIPRTVIRKNMIVEHSLEQALMAVDIDRLNHVQNGSLPDIFIGCADVVRAMVTGERCEWAIDAILACDTAIEMAEKLMKFHVEKAVPENFLNFVDQRLTDIATTVFRLQIGYGHWKIDSFTADIAALAKDLESKSQSLVDVFNISIKRAARVGLSSLDATDSDLTSIYHDILSNLLNRDNVGEEIRNMVTFFGQGVAIANLNISSENLGFDVSEEPRLLSEEMSPMMFTAAKAIFTEMAEINAIERVLIQTCDSCLFEISKGVFGDNSWIVCKVTR